MGYSSICKPFLHSGPYIYFLHAPRSVVLILAVPSLHSPTDHRPHPIIPPSWVSLVHLLPPTSGPCLCHPELTGPQLTVTKWLWWRLAQEAEDDAKNGSSDHVGSRDGEQTWEKMMIAELRAHSLGPNPSAPWVVPFFPTPIPASITRDAKLNAFKMHNGPYARLF